MRLGPVNIPSVKRPALDEHALEWFMLHAPATTDAEVAPPLFDFSQPPPIVLREGDTMSLNGDEVAAFWLCESPQAFLILWDKVVVKRGGRVFPMPGWHNWIIASGLLDTRRCQWKDLPSYDKWVEVICTPQKGYQLHYDERYKEKALRTNWKEDGNKATPKKIKVLVTVPPTAPRKKVKRGLPVKMQEDKDHDDAYEEMHVVDELSSSKMSLD